MKKKTITAEFIFVLYFFGFATLRPIVFLAQSKSTLVIFAFILITVLLSLFNSHTFNKNSFFKWLVISALAVFILYFSPKEIRSTYMMNFFMYGVLPLFLLLNVDDYELVLQWVVRFSCLNGIVLILDPFFDYQLNGTYMSYGLNMLVFSFSGLLVGHFYLKNKRLFGPLLIEMAMILFFGNKGAGIASIVLFICSMFLTGSSIRRLAICGIACVGAFNWRIILLWIIKCASFFGFSSYALTTFYIILTENADSVFSSRTNIWETANTWIQQNPIFGYGVGKFEIANNGYVHNIFYEITLAFGYLGLVIFVLLLLRSIYKMYHNPYPSYKILQAICLGCWLIPLQFSLTFWSVSAFWVYWGLYLFDDSYKRCKIESISSDV